MSIGSAHMASHCVRGGTMEGRKGSCASSERPFSMVKGLKILSSLTSFCSYFHLTWKVIRCVL